MECSHQQSVEKWNAASLFLCSWDQVTKWIKRNNFFEEVAVDTSALKISAILWVQKLVCISVEVTIDIVSIYTLHPRYTGCNSGHTSVQHYYY